MKYVKTVEDSSGGISEIHFAINPNHWDVPPDGITDVILKHYPTTDSVRDALMDGSLDAVIGGGVLSEADIALFKYNNSASVSVSLTESIQNRIIVFNTNRTPTDDLQNRKVIIHAIDKATIIDEEFAGLADVAESLFPKNAPCCGADLTPKPDYDIEKAQLLNCPAEPEIDLHGRQKDRTIEGCHCCYCHSLCRLHHGWCCAGLHVHTREGR